MAGDAVDPVGELAKRDPSTRDSCSFCISSRTEIETLRSQVEALKKDIAYHSECRPNRRQAEAAIADAKAMNDRWADERVRAEAAESALAQLRAAVEQIAENRRHEEPMAWMALYTFHGTQLAELRYSHQDAMTILDAKRGDEYGGHEVRALYGKPLIAELEDALRLCCEG